MEIVILIILAAVSYWFFVLRPGRIDFWKMASNNPDAAYDHFISNDCWKVFEDGLPDNYRNMVPKDEWTGPFSLFIPKLGNKMIKVFGKYPDFENSQNEFIKKYG